eukprot:gb/GECH01008727.1/.p1 GENE.gb/GECH01008727.1/~~gb/GECH01008727.1/.p1  ORF type:complete len:184 (+),score=3.11 gb/GECH01008727.1/:1-552(+)
MFNSLVSFFNTHYCHSEMYVMGILNSKEKSNVFCMEGKINGKEKIEIKIFEPLSGAYNSDSSIANILAILRLFSSQVIDQLQKNKQHRIQEIGLKKLPVPKSGRPSSSSSSKSSDSSNSYRRKSKSTRASRYVGRGKQNYSGTMRELKVLETVLILLNCGFFNCSIESFLFNIDFFNLNHSRL